MKILTRKFGTIDIDESRVLKMPDALPGFPGKKKFILLEKEETRPFCWLQSVEDPDIALVIMNPFLFMPDYAVDLKSVIHIMSWQDTRVEDLLVYVVVNFTDEAPRKITANLIGPLIINPEKYEAVQMVLHDSPYSHQHPIL